MPSNIQKYSDNSFTTGNQEWQPKIYCLDDLGAETIMKHYGTDADGQSAMSWLRFFFYRVTIYSSAMPCSHISPPTSQPHKLKKVMVPESDPG